MAFRRPASSRARLNSTTNPMPPPAQIPRSRSVMAKSSSSTRSADDVQSTTTAAHRTQKSSQDAETNIQVVIRCRRRSEREIQEGSPNIISSAGAKSKELNIEVGIPQPSFGIETFPPVRTYPFDLVFGPEADQAMVYHDVVHPMLEQVLMGYNCTLFAYGQTGTGKTHTMQGDLVPTPLGNPSSNAGMIPRTLFRLFHQLDSTNSDYSVKVSFVELYNEELRDLLAEEFTAPAGSIQPMGMAAKDKNVDNGLKIFDDANKRGVFIQGLEEVPVKDSKDALALLTKGSQRRQIASTKFNDHSSRSHSVFSITVHIKETSTMGDDLLKIGKLNLVDLAGSENIGRSGAENKRAREAGMINQSLLTLGRVINALVDKAQHVPYRESKLTRLLQDSLGGRTKTCIIATISPTRSNVEETLSTLDYAMKAKSIHNKPELNQRMTRNSLLKEYVAEIERLKADLLAAREKNGIFISEETWNEHNAEQELRQTELDEARKQVEIVESQMRSVREEFEQSIALLMKTDGELRDTKAKLKYTEEVLVEKEGQLKVTQEALEDEVVVRKAYQETESVLDNVAIGLKNVAVESIQDMEGLFDKLDRKTKILTLNTHTASKSEKMISKTTHILSQQLIEFKQAASQSLHKLQEDTKQYEIRQLDALAIQSERMDQRSRHIREVLELIQTKDISETKALEIVQKVLQEMHAVFKSEVTVWGEGLMKSCFELCEQTKVAVDKDFPHLEKALQNFSSLIETLAGDARKHIKTEGEHLTRAQTLVADAAAQEIAHLRKQNEELVQMLANERVLADKAKDQLIQRVSGLLSDFTMERDNRLRETVGAMQKQNKDRESIVKTFTEEHSEMMESMQSSASTMDANLHKREVESKKTREGVVKTLKRAREAYKSDLDNITKTVSRSVGTYSTQIHEKSTIMAGSYDEAFDNHLQAKRARLDATMTLDNDLHSDYESMQETIATTSKTLQAYTEQMGHNGSDLETLTETYHSSALKHLEGVQHAATTLAEKGLHEDVPTGTTPRKRAWTYIDQWQLTGSREDLLKVQRERQLSSLNSSQQSTVPEEDENLQLTAISIPSSPIAPETPIEQDTLIPVISAEAQAGSMQKGLSETKSTVLVMGTLVDSRKRNIPLTRASRRIR